MFVLVTHVLKGCITLKKACLQDVGDYIPADNQTLRTEVVNVSSTNVARNAAIIHSAIAGGYTKRWTTGTIMVLCNHCNIFIKHTI